MAGSKQGGKAAAATNKARYGDDFYKTIGSIGGTKSGAGGFAWMKANGQTEKIRAAGRVGGRISRKAKK